MRATLAGLALPCLALAIGCGTVGNVLGPRQFPHLYGGAEFDCLALEGTWSRLLSEGRARCDSARADLDA